MSDMYYDYAQSILNAENLQKFTGFVDQVFSLRKFGTLFFYGPREKTLALARKMNNNYPVMFGFRGRGASDPAVTIYQEPPYPKLLPGTNEDSVIILTEVIPDGTHPNHIIFF
jgi:hypothetical protein